MKYLVALVLLVCGQASGQTLPGIKPVLSYMGTWSSSTVYKAGAVIDYNGNMYMRKIAASGSIGTVTLIQNNAACPSTGSLAFGSNVTSGHLIIVTVNDTTTNTTGMTVSDTVGTTYTAATSVASSFYSHTEVVYYGLAAASGSNTVSTSAHDASSSCLAISEFSNVTNSIDVATNTVQGSSTAHISLAVGTDTSPDLVFSAVGGYHASITFTADSGNTLIAQADGSVGVASAYQVTSNAGSIATGFTLSANFDTSTLCVVAFKASLLTPDTDPTNWDMFTTSGYTQPPDISTWTQYDFGSSTVTQAFGWIQIIPQNGSRTWRALYHTMPSTPWTMTARIAFNGLTTTDGGCAIGWMDGSGKSEMLQLLEPNGLNWQHFNADGSFAANVFTSSYAWQGNGIGVLRIKYDGTNMTGYSSNDGKNWTLLASETTSFITPTRYVFGAYDNNSTPSGVTGPMTGCTLKSLEFQ